MVTRGQLLDQMCTLFGGREAEVLLCDDLSIGSAADLDRATGIARALVEEFGMGGDEVGVRRIDKRTEHDVEPSDELKSKMEAEALKLLEEQRARAADILRGNKQLVETLRDLLLERKVLDREALGSLLPKGINEKKETPPEG